MNTVTLLSLLFFLNGLSISTFGRFAAVFFVSCGLSAFQIGALEGVMPIIRVLVAPFWGYLSDHLNGKKLVTQINKVLSTLFIALLAVPWLSSSFEMILFMTSMASVFSGAGSILDAYALDVAKGSYGKIRLWTAVAFGVGSFVMGLVADATNDTWTWNFVLFGVFGCVFVAMTSWWVPDVAPAIQQRAQGQEQQSQSTQSSLPHLLHLLFTSKAFVCVFLESTLFGAANGVLERLLFVFLKVDLAASTFLCGAVVLVGVALELPVFWCEAAIRKRISTDGMALIGTGVYIVRVFSYISLTRSTVAWVLMIETMHGITYALFWLYVIEKSNCDRIHNDLLRADGHDPHEHGQEHHHRGLIQSLVGNAFRCVGTGGGAMLGGYVMHMWGSNALFMGLGVTMSIYLILKVLYIIIHKQSQQKEQQQQQQQNGCDDLHHQHNNNRADGFGQHIDDDEGNASGEAQEIAPTSTVVVVGVSQLEA
eukprot:PhM_4_TR3084/c1_g1_i2/m.53790